jgi:uncharacterized protein (DUF488 family)
MCGLVSRGASTSALTQKGLPSRTTIWTVGHSTKSLEGFLRMLRAHGISALADVRRFPRSRRHPHFNQEELSQALVNCAIEYVHFPELGGRRSPRGDSPNTVWRSEGFRGYADYMMTDPFTKGMERLLVLTAAKPTALMCAEAVWWRCHRALISDYLKAVGKTVLHILSETKTEPHPFTSAARIVEGRLTYGPASASLEFKLE